MNPSRRLRGLSTGLLILGASLLLIQTSSAQIAHHPFAIGANEGAVGHQTGLGAFILAQESRFYLGLTSAVRAVKTSYAGLLLLTGLSFAYGIFHAAGPGHGKAVITSYMVSNEVAMRRGLLISLCAALLQGVIATALVGIAAYAFGATAQRMTAAAQAIEFASYLGIVALGLMLVWRKGRALAAALRPIVPAATPVMLVTATGHDATFETTSLRTALSTSRFVADDGMVGHVHDGECGCGHAHMPDPAAFAEQRFNWKAAAIAIVTAGARPCSGAILVLVFSLSQGLFLAGIAATFAMALGTAMTTGGLAATAVFAKDLAIKLAGQRAGRALVLGRSVEFAAAACVLLFGIALLAASLSGVHAAA